MRGLHRRKGSEVWQGRYRIPSPLWRERHKLVELGVSDMPKAQEHSRSTGKRDRAEAERVYALGLINWNDKLAAWEALLRDGPQALTFKQRVALAADHAKAFLAAHEEEPFDAPSLPIVSEPPEA